MKMKHTLVLVSIFVLPVLSHAGDWGVTVGLSSASNRSSPPDGVSKVRTEMVNSSITNKLNQKTTLGGSFSFGSGSANNSVTDGKSNTDINNIGIFVIRDIGSLRFMNLSLGYGSVATNGSIDNENIDFSFDGNSSSVSLGLTQFVPIKSTILASLNARTSYAVSRTDAYRDSAGIIHESSKQSKSMNSIGAGLSWRYGLLTPSLNLSYVFSNREHTAGLTDKDFYRYSLGLRYNLSSDTKLNFGYGGVLDKAANKENLVRVSVTQLF